MHRFEEEDHEPVAVVRTLSDFALALTLVVLMLIGTRSAAESKGAAETRAASAQPGKTNAALTVVLAADSKFTVLSDRSDQRDVTAATLAQPWIAAHPNGGATIVVQFPPKTLAADLHRALLNLQSAFGTNLSRIDTLPQL